MSISAITNDTQQTQSSVLGSTSGKDVTQTFLTLLTTELKSQDPTAPMDATAMVGQLVQFNTLGEIMRIRELLEPVQATGAQSTTGGH
jgi:flagellar basal-body rod modification protein FlgD